MLVKNFGAQIHVFYKREQFLINSEIVSNTLQIHVAEIHKMYILSSAPLIKKVRKQINNQWLSFTDFSSFKISLQYLENFFILFRKYLQQDFFHFSPRFILSKQCISDALESFNEFLEEGSNDVLDYVFTWF